jgi:anti-sigma-K factor RskA
MVTDHEHWLEQCETYALGALDGEERNEFEVHLASGCTVCPAYIRQARETLLLLDRSLKPLLPPAAVKAKIFEQITPKRPLPPVEESHWRSWRWWFVGAGSFATAAIVLALTWNMMNSRSEVEKLKGQLAVTQSEVAQKDELIQFLAAPEVRSVQLAGLEAAPAASGKLFWNPTTRRGLLMTFGLPKTAADKAYELWGIAGNEPVPAGVFLVDDGGQARFDLPPLAAERNFEKFAVTLEPAGGVAKPSGPMVLLGSL